MKDYKFLTYSEIEAFFKTSNIKSIKKTMDESFLICSTSDILYISEQFKKNNIKTTITELSKNLEILCDVSNPIYFPEIDRDVLLENLFDTEENNITLWEKACNMKVSPRFSISMIAIRISNSSFWSEETFNEMEEYYNNYE